MRAALVLVLALASARASADPVVEDGAPATTGDLDKEVIRSAIRHEIMKLQFCYEKQLLAKPGIAGQIDATFVIAPSGAVSSATATGFDPDVASCIASVIKTVAFPRPKGGSVQVNYPFTFRPSDETAGLEAKGDLDKAIIRRYVVRNLQKIQYCYEKALLAKPGLAGAITVEFTIGTKGVVDKATPSGFDAEVGTCVAGVIKAIEFPRPKSGVVEVRYPFNFRDSSIAPSKPAKPAVPSVDVTGGIEAKGDLDKAIIRRYVVRNLQKIQYCYEKTLLAKPGIEGTTTVELTIGTTGKVDKATASGFDAEVGTCVAEVIKAIEFPRPKSGTVEVRYPFNFKSR